MSTCQSLRKSTLIQPRTSLGKSDLENNLLSELRQSAEAPQANLEPPRLRESFELVGARGAREASGADAACNLLLWPTFLRFSICEHERWRVLEHISSCLGNFFYEGQ